jgi:mRNA-degrading endonuclease toxin of MazEF toxin-antitoxin module
MEKRFQEWIELKQKLHEKEIRPSFVKERELWWFSVGENIGKEINGKSRVFSRPGLIIKRLSQHLFLIAPTTSKIREGSWFISIGIKKFKTCACLHQIRVVDHKRMLDRIGQITERDFENVKERFHALYK